jgi:hypothetical protein
MIGGITTRIDPLGAGRMIGVRLLQISAGVVRLQLLADVSALDSKVLRDNAGVQERS